MDAKDAKDTEFSVLEGSWMELDISSEFKTVYHADHVRRHSKILGWMMNDSPCETWARGLAAAFQGHAPAHVELFMALASAEEENMNNKCSKLFESRVRNSWEDVAGVVSLADKLNAPLIMEVGWLFLFISFLLLICFAFLEIRRLCFICMSKGL